MLGKIIVLVILGLSSVNACASKFVAPGNGLRCMECVDNFGKCDSMKMVFCDEEAANRTMKMYKEQCGGDITNDGTNICGEYEQCCHYNNIKFTDGNDTKIFIIRGCMPNGTLTAQANDSFNPLENACTCSKDYCNSYDEVLFNGGDPPNKFHSQPYDFFPPVGENYCPKPENTTSTTPGP